jgi:hypothetical protein
MPATLCHSISGRLEALGDVRGRFRDALDVSFHRIAQDALGRILFEVLPCGVLADRRDRFQDVLEPRDHFG